MNVTEYTYLLNRPNAINDKQTQLLEKVIDSFPYFQSARAMYLKGLYNQDSYKYNFALKTTAAHTADRSILFDFITSDEFTIIRKEIYEEKLAQLMDITVSHENIRLPEAKTETETIETSQTAPINNVIIETADQESVTSYIEQAEVPTIITEREINEVVTELQVVEDEFLKEKEKSYSITEAISTIEATLTNDESPLLNTSVQENTNTEQVIEEKLEIGKPIAFSSNEKHSFHEWLQLTSFKPIDRNNPSQKNNDPVITKKESENILKPDPRQKKIELIDKFIQSNPKITPAKDAIPTPAIAISQPDTSQLMTETLAKVYLEQKKYQKAIQAYEILILKYPEKSYFFADRIKDIKFLQQNNN